MKIKPVSEYLENDLPGDTREGPRGPDDHERLRMSEQPKCNATITRNGETHVCKKEPHGSGNHVCFRWSDGAAGATPHREPEQTPVPGEPSPSPEAMKAAYECANSWSAFDEADYELNKSWQEHTARALDAFAKQAVEAAIADTRERCALIVEDAACGCGDNSAMLIRKNDVPKYEDHLIAKKIREAVEAEREACALECAEAVIRYRNRTTVVRVAEKIERAIRARGGK